MKTNTTTLTPELLHQMDAYWRAANYLSVGQIYFYDNPLLKQPLKLAHIKPRLLGHWGTTPGLNFVYAHLNRVIKEHDLNVIYITGPGHGGPGLVANAWLEGTYSEVHPNIAQDEDGMQRLFKQFSFPGGIPSHVAPETPGSIHEGGELGYSLSHAFGAAFDNPDLLVACVVGDGEAETGPLATSWHSNKFLNPVHDGAVLPILHLNGYKIAGPTVLARIPHDELEALFRGYGYTPYFVEGEEPVKMHQLMAATLDVVVADIRRIQREARAKGFKARPRWPMIILRSPKGWTGPKIVDGKPAEGTFRSHQVPMGEMSHPGHVKILEKWLKSYRPQELFDQAGKLRSELADLAPKGERRMSANPHANGGLLLQDLRLPDFRDYATKVPKPGAVNAEATRVQGEFIRDVTKRNPKNFRVFSPDETSSNRWGAVLEVTNRCSTAAIVPGDDHVAPDGRVMEMLSEHQCEGWLEGYLLTGRHGLFSCYEAFIHIVDSMFNQHAKWLKVANHIPWLGWTCGECRYCRSARENLCDRARFTGYTLDGGYAEFTVADARFCFPIPEFYSDAEAAPLLCAGLIGYRSLVKTDDARRLGIYGFGAAAHIVAQVARHQGRAVFAFTRPGDTAAQRFARSLGAVWAGDAGTSPPEELDAAMIFAPVGELVPQALRAVAKGRIVVWRGNHMSDIPSFPYEILWQERTICSVANLTRRDGEEFLALAPRVPVRTEIETFPLEEANDALARLRSSKLQGAAVLVMD